MKINKLDRFETKKQSDITPEQVKQSREMFVNLLTPVIEKMLKNPSGIRPVSDSFESLARQAKSGIVRQTTIIQSGENPVFKSPTPTLYESGNDGDGSKIVTETYTDEQKIILEKLSNEIS